MSIRSLYVINHHLNYNERYGLGDDRIYVYIDDQEKPIEVSLNKKKEFIDQNILGF